ncbi:MAG: ribonuclease HI [Acidobacteria bacterium]|nr:ribonuclease HI [Acidobacteriota bacterium]
MNQRIVVFTDGSSKGNPGPGGWGVIIITPDSQVRELGGGDARTTNNRMELTGAIEALRAVRAWSEPLDIYTDSTYVIQGIREWIHGWKRRGWKTATGGDVLNRELWEALSDLTAARGPRNIRWHYVRGHVGTPGNERVDRIADGFATANPLPLYEGPMAAYPVADVMRLPDDTAVPPRSGNGSNGRSSSAAAYSYLSVVDGQPMRHRTWAECEARVKGRSGARYKKATSAADEAAILRGWNIDPGTL